VSLLQEDAKARGMQAQALRCSLWHGFAPGDLLVQDLKPAITPRPYGHKQNLLASPEPHEPYPVHNQPRITPGTKGLKQS
jgi:hypothetical protein